ncbi:MAG: hypothetical protein IT304_00660, partial [Dehalococcoidia bacterium]|nr:hypothetical protein [Dehalococcoidia bacterium]
GWFLFEGPGAQSDALLRLVRGNTIARLNLTTLGDELYLTFFARGSAGGTLVIRDVTALSAYLGRWHHVAAVYSSDAGAALYVDGSLRATGPALGPIDTDPADLTIGYAGEGTLGTFDGRLDEVRVWSLARSQAEIAEAMARRLRGDEPGLEGYWRLDEPGGQRVLDATGHGYHGVLGSTLDDAPEPTDPQRSAPGAPIADGDCNGDGTLDICEIEAGAADCDANGRLDTCGFAATDDCNANGLPDLCDLAPDASGDCDANRVPDDCDALAPGADIDHDGVPDVCRFPLAVDRVTPCSLVYLAPYSGTGSVRVVTRTGQAVTALLPGQAASAPGSFGVDGAGNLLLGRPDLSRVVRLTPQGEVLPGFMPVASPHGTALAPDGRVAVCSSTGNYVRIFDAAGAIVAELRQQVRIPRCLAFDRSGSLYVGCFISGQSTYVAKFDRNHQFVRTFGEGVLSNLPFDIALNRDEVLYVSAVSGVHLFTRSGASLGVITRPGLSPGGLAFDETGMLWVTNRGGGSIYRFNADNQFVDVLVPDLSVPLHGDLYGIAFGTGATADCNANGQEDRCEIEAGTSQDCDLNAVPDECDPLGEDCDGNGIQDECDPDCDGNGRPDPCDLAEGAPDGDGDGVLDACETGACCTATACTDTTPEACVTFVCDVRRYHAPGYLGCWGDMDGNNLVNPGDRGVISANIGQTNRDLVCQCDLDGNGVVNPGDRGFIQALDGLCAPLPPYMNGTGLNAAGDNHDNRFPPIFLGLETTCATVTCP